MKNNSCQSLHRQLPRKTRPGSPSLLSLVVLLSLGLSAANQSLHAQSAPEFQVNWSSVDGGGALQSRTGNFSVSGTIGQPDAGPLIAGSQRLTGGFWSGITVPRPRLRISPSARNVLIAWPDPSAGYQLEESLTLPSTFWTPVTQPPTVVNGEKQLIVPANGATRFYRLKRP
jgi:hypothetical protein